ncbi:MAG TPA: glutathione S-transferase [Steroidobacteraceae bacterium]|nr:glutathione S-transferase [Steroidobacteraceae bacterium]
MAKSKTITLFHSPQTRSSSALALLEELKAPYQLHVLNMKAGEQRASAYLAINPMGKVPAILHGDVLVTEQVAIGIYLSDLFPAAGITPAIDDALRGPYLRWYAFYAACFEPALIDKALKREPGPVGTVPYGDLDTTMKTLIAQLDRGPWMLGERFTSVDVLWGTALTWMTGFGLVEPVAPVKNYIDRWNARPSVKKVAEIDAGLLKDQGNA